MMQDQRVVARMEIYKALAGCYLAPDQQLHELVDILEHHVPDQLADLMPVVREMGESLPPPSGDWEPLRLDHARLFVGPFEVLAPPYGSVYFNRDKMLQDQSTEDVARLYHRAGLVSGDELLGPPDHVSAEMEFMYVLLFNEQAVGDAGDNAQQAEKWRLMRHDFFRKHLGGWGPVFADKVRQWASQPFYRLLGDVTTAVLALEAREQGLEKEGH